MAAIDIHGILVRLVRQKRLDNGQDRVTEVNIRPSLCDLPKCFHRVRSVRGVLAFRFSDRDLEE